MLSREQSRVLTKRIAVISYLEVLLWPLIMIPAASAALPLVILEYGIGSFLVGIFCYVALLGLLGTLVDLIITLFRGKSRRIDERLLSQLQGAFDQLADRGAPKLQATKTRVSPADLSVRGYVRGVVASRVVVSGGMLVGMIRKLSTAEGVMCHEIGHVANGDKFFFAIIALWFVNSFGFFLIPFMDHDPYAKPGSGILPLISIFVTFWVLSQLSKRREIMADVYAAALCGRTAYLGCFRNLTTNATSSGGVFHPSIYQRQLRLNLNTPRSLRPSWLVLAYCLAACSPGLLAYLDSGDLFFLATGTASLLGLTVEMSRLLLFPRYLIDEL